MDESTEILVCMAAAVASNCVPCFEHYYRRACAVGIPSDTINAVVEQARKVQGGAQVLMRGRLSSLLGSSENQGLGCCSGGTRSDGSCCP